MTWHKIALMVLAVLAAPSFGQTTETSDDDKGKAVLKDDLWPSARAAGMGGALSTLADGLDAPYYNPAGIGGIHNIKAQEKKIVRNLTFPYIGIEVGSSSLALKNKFASTDTTEADPLVTAAVLGADSGSRQYGRMAVVPAVVVGRFFFGYQYDNQIAAFSLGEGTGLVRTNHSVTTGPGAGFSATDPGGSLYLGAYAASLSRSTVAGDFSVDDIANPLTRKDALAQGKHSSTASDANIGMIWTIADKGRPTLGIAVRHVGDTAFSGGEAEALVEKQNVTMAMSVSPHLGKWGFFNAILEIENLTDPELAMMKKFNAGMELTVGGLFGNSSGFGLRVGANGAGASYGVHANLGLIGVQLSSYAEDLGEVNKVVVERRYVAVFSIDLAH